MLAVSGAVTVSAALSAYRVFWGKWDGIDQEKSMAPRFAPPPPQLHPRACTHTHTHTHTHHH